MQGYGTGDLHVRITVEVPHNLNSAQKAKLMEFAGLVRRERQSISKGFFEKAKRLFKG